MQARGDADWAQTPLDRLLARTDVAAHTWIAERLVAGDDLEPAAPPPRKQDERELPDAKLQP